MQTIQCKLYSNNICNNNGTCFLMRQKNTKVLLVKGDTNVEGQEELNYYKNQTGYLIRIHHNKYSEIKQFPKVDIKQNYIFTVLFINFLRSAPFARKTRC